MERPSRATAAPGTAIGLRYTGDFVGAIGPADVRLLRTRAGSSSGGRRQRQRSCSLVRVRRCDEFAQAPLDVSDDLKQDVAVGAHGRHRALADAEPGDFDKRRGCCR